MGSRLPSRRELAEHLGCSLATVDGAYSLLAEEGYAFSRERSGFFVSRDFDRPREEPPEAVLRLSRDPEGAPAPGLVLCGLRPGGHWLGADGV